jgi:hypothetical protein
MNKLYLVLLSACLVIGLAGCSDVSKPYVIKVDRTDQEMTAGNRGYIKGTPPPVGDRGELKRPLIAVDVDLAQIKGPKSTEVSEDSGDVRPSPAAAPVRQAVAAAKEEQIKYRVDGKRNYRPESE